MRAHYTEAVPRPSGGRGYYQHARRPLWQTGWNRATSGDWSRTLRYRGGRDAWVPQVYRNACTICVCIVRRQPGRRRRRGRPAGPGRSVATTGARQTWRRRRLRDLSPIEVRRHIPIQPQVRRRSLLVDRRPNPRSRCVAGAVARHLPYMCRA